MILGASTCESASRVAWVSLVVARGADVDALADAPALRGYHHVPAVRADLLARLGRHEDGRAEFARAAALTANAREHAMLLAEAGRLEAP